MSKVKLFEPVDKCFHIGVGGSNRQSNVGLSAMHVEVCYTACSDWKLCKQEGSFLASYTSAHAACLKLPAEEAIWCRTVKGEAALLAQDELV